MRAGVSLQPPGAPSKPAFLHSRHRYAGIFSSCLRGPGRSLWREWEWFGGLGRAREDCGFGSVNEGRGGGMAVGFGGLSSVGEGCRPLYLK